MLRVNPWDVFISTTEAAKPFGLKTMVLHCWEQPLAFTSFGEHEFCPIRIGWVPSEDGHIKLLVKDIEETKREIEEKYGVAR